MLHENFHGALLTLAKQSNMELFYTCSSRLMGALPEATVDAWIAKGHQLDPSRLMFALVQYEGDDYQETLRYLEYCVHELECRHKSIHHYLLSLYAKHHPDRLLM